MFKVQMVKLFFGAKIEKNKCLEKFFSLQLSRTDYCSKNGESIVFISLDKQGYSIGEKLRSKFLT